MQDVEFPLTLTSDGINVPLTLEKPTAGWLFLTNQHLLFTLNALVQLFAVFFNALSPNMGLSLLFFFPLNVAVPSQCILRPFTMKEA